MTRIFRSEGNFFEDFAIGDVYRHSLGRTISTADNRWFTLLTMNTNELHFNADMASRTEHGREVVNSGLTVAMLLGISVADISQNAFANLGWSEINLVAPVFIGDTLYGESLITATRASTSRPDVGIVGCRTRGLNQHGAEVLNFRRAAMVYTRAAGSRVRQFPESKTPIADTAG